MTLSDYRTAIVTGASSGIGLAVAQMLDAAGIKVVAVARRSDHLEELERHSNCRAVVLDVADRDAVRRLVSSTTPDIIVNNAGVGHGVTGLADLTSAEIAASVRINIEAPMQITAAACPAMIERGRGHIVNIGSIAGLYPLVSALYGAGKAGLHRFSQNLRVELLATGVRVTEICPGRVSSEFYESASGDPGKLASMKHSGITELTPHDVAESVRFALAAPSHVNIGTIELTPVEQVIGGTPLTPSSA